MNDDPLLAKNEAPFLCIFGNKVTLKNLVSNKEVQFKLVPFTEEKLDQNEISNYTEIGKAIWAKAAGVELELNIPGIGNGLYQIKHVEPF